MCLQSAAIGIPVPTASALEGAEGASQGGCSHFLALEMCAFPQLASCLLAELFGSV